MESIKGTGQIVGRRTQVTVLAAGMLAIHLAASSLESPWWWPRLREMIGLPWSGGQLAFEFLVWLFVVDMLAVAVFLPGFWQNRVALFGLQRLGRKSTKTSSASSPTSNTLLTAVKVEGKLMKQAPAVETDCEAASTAAGSSAPTSPAPSGALPTPSTISPPFSRLPTPCEEVAPPRIQLGGLNLDEDDEIAETVPQAVPTRPVARFQQQAAAEDAWGSARWGPGTLGA